MFVLLLVISLSINSCSTLPSHIQIGGLFTSEQREEEFFFRLAVANINDDPTILARTKLVAQVKNVNYFDSFHANKQGKFCVFCLCFLFLLDLTPTIVVAVNSL